MAGGKAPLGIIDTDAGGPLAVAMPALSVQVLRKSMSPRPKLTLSPSSLESAAGLAYVAAALSCAAMAEPDMARSRALVLGTMYPPASAAEGRAAARARMSLRMLVPPYGATRISGGWTSESRNAAASSCA